MERAFKCRDQLGEDFARMTNLALGSAGLRSLHVRATQLQLEPERKYWNEQQSNLTQQFRDSTLSMRRPSLVIINKASVAKLESLHKQRCSHEKGGIETRHTKRRNKGARESTRHNVPGIDLSVVQATLSWLDLGSEASAQERRSWLKLIRELLAVSLVHPGCR